MFWPVCWKSKIQNNVSAIVSQKPRVRRRHDLGENMSKNHNTVGDMVSAKIWGRFWCMQYRLWQPCRFETTQCNSLDNSSNWVLQVQVVDQTTHPPKCHSFVGLDRQIGSSPPANVKRFPANVNRFESKKFYICSDVTHTHTPSRGRVGKLRSGQWDEDEIERKWRWGEDENEMKVT